MLGHMIGQIKPKTAASGNLAERSAELCKAVKDAEEAGDKITHETIARLHKTWITPIDRADIHSLITALDDVLDLIEAVSERVALYEVKAAGRGSVRWADGEALERREVERG